MKIFKTIIIYFSISLCMFAKYDIENINKDITNLFNIVSSTQDINIDNEIITIDLRRLIIMTSMIESRMGQDPYNGRIAKTYMQIEENTARHYIVRVGILKEFIESKINRKLQWDKDEDAIYVSYLLYMAKLKFHCDYLQKNFNKYNGKQDYEWAVYKIFYNTKYGSSSYKTWLKRENEFIEL